MPSFSAPYQALLDHCESNKLKFRADRARKAVMFSMCGEAAVYRCLLLITHDDEVFQVYIDYPVMAKDPKMRPMAAEFVARANHRLAIGHFDLDMSDGEVRFHVGHVIGGQGLDDETIGRLVSTALGTANRYFSAFMRMMFGGHTAEDAVFLSELDTHSASASKDGEKPSSGSPDAKPPPPAPRPQAKKPPRRPRKNQRPKSHQELPGSLDKNLDKEGGGPRRA